MKKACCKCNRLAWMDTKEDVKTSAFSPNSPRCAPGRRQKGRDCRPVVSSPTLYLSPGKLKLLCLAAATCVLQLVLQASTLRLLVIAVAFSCVSLIGPETLIHPLVMHTFMIQGQFLILY